MIEIWTVINFISFYFPYHRFASRKSNWKGAQIYYGFLFGWWMLCECFLPKIQTQVKTMKINCAGGYSLEWIGKLFNRHFRNKTTHFYLIFDDRLCINSMILPFDIVWMKMIYLTINLNNKNKMSMSGIFYVTPIQVL